VPVGQRPGVDAEEQLEGPAGTPDPVAELDRKRGVAAVEAGDDREAGLVCRRSEPVELLRGQAWGLFDEHGLARPQRPLRQLGVRRMPAGDGDDVDVVGAEQLVYAVQSFEPELRLRGMRRSPGCARDRLQLESGGREARDERALGEAARADHSHTRAGRRRARA